MTEPSLAGTWAIDPTHTRIGFATRHAMVTKVRGAFNDIAGIAEFTDAGTEGATVSVTVQMASIDTRNTQRDEHLRGADFFDVENHPEMTFISHSLEEVDENGYIVTGDLTIMGKTRNISIPLRFMGINTDPFGFVRAGFEGTRRLDRRDWGITYNAPLAGGGLLIGDRIQLEFELSLILQASDQGEEAVEAASDEEQPAVEEQPAAEEQSVDADIIDDVPTSAAEQDGEQAARQEG
ncbi:YceI family protein [Brachybacterium sp. DNPG3]